MLKLENLSNRLCLLSDTIYHKGFYHKVEEGRAGDKEQVQCRPTVLVAIALLTRHRQVDRKSLGVFSFEVENVK